MCIRDRSRFSLQSCIKTKVSLPVLSNNFSLLINSVIAPKSAIEILTVLMIIEVFLEKEEKNQALHMRMLMIGSLAEQ